jgi:hypothetical protein
VLAQNLANDVYRLHAVRSVGLKERGLAFRFDFRIRKHFGDGLLGGGFAVMPSSKAVFFRLAESDE